MLSDRQYMRESRRDSPDRPGEVADDHLHRALSAPAGRGAVARQDDWYYGWFGLSAGAVLHGQRPWTLLTYNFLQNTAGYTGGVFGLIFNLLGLYFFGGDLRGLIGTRRLAWLYAGFIVVGALAWCAVYPLGVYWPLFGPAVTLAGIFALYCCYHANEQMTFLAFFIIPVTAKPKFFCWCLGGARSRRLPVLRDDRPALAALERPHCQPRRHAHRLRLLPARRPGRSVRRHRPPGSSCPAGCAAGRRPPPPRASK